MNQSDHIARIAGYYERTQWFYDLFWTDCSTRSMNYGFWGADTRCLRDAFANQNRFIHERLGLDAGRPFLEAGCGTGGSTLWLAKEYGWSGVGITIAPTQVVRAISYARRAGLSALVEFGVADYCATGFADNQFGGVFASESCCYAPLKGDFFREAHRVLAPGGRLLIIDGFRRDNQFTLEESKLFTEWANGWRIPDLVTIDGCADMLSAAGFVDVQFEDLRGQVMRSSRKLRTRALMGYPVILMLKLMSIANDEHVGHVLSAIRQYDLLQREVCGYGAFSCRKSIDPLRSVALFPLEAGQERVEDGHESGFR